MNKATLRRVGAAALTGMSDREIAQNPVGAMNMAMGAMRGALDHEPPPPPRCTRCGGRGVYLERFADNFLTVCPCTGSSGVRPVT